MATHKLNTLHIHFSDDEGFRLTLDQYPTLRSIGSRRGFGQMIAPMVFLQANLDKTYTGKRPYPYADTIYAHSYSKSDIKKLIAYANVRKITIIPEIDLPGHAHALIKSLPNSFVDPSDHSKFASVQGYTHDVLPICTYNTNISVGPKFTKDINIIVKKIAEMFDGQTSLYALHNEISVGGDEVSSDAWTDDASCQGDLSKLKALDKEHYFFHQLALNNHDILFSGWQQLVQNDDISLGYPIVSSLQTGHIWVWSKAKQGIDQAVNLAKNNYGLVLTFADQTYFDLTYTADIDEPGFTWATDYSDTYAALSSSLSAEAILNRIPKAAQKANLLGIEGSLWSENLATYEHLIYMALPKMAGLAEASWSPAKNIDWRNFSKRLGCGDSGFLYYLNKLYAIHYRGYPNGISLEIPDGMCKQFNKDEKNLSEFKKNRII
jgi:hexosaminidase